MKVTVFKRPNGLKEVIDMKNINGEDEMWFLANGVKISMEEDGADGFIIYADIGRKDEDGEPDEIILLSKGRTCVQCMTALRKECDEAME